MKHRKAVILAAGLSLASLAAAQQTLSLDEALTMAKERNGSVQAAFLNYRASQKNARSAFSAFLPSVTPSLSKDWGRSETLTGPFRSKDDFTSTNAALDVSWRLFDDGTRQDRYDQARFSAEAQQFNALQTLRNTLFSVHSRFYDALRAQELLRVQNDNLERARVILEQTKFRANPPIEDVPKKDVLQAEADYQNARVSVLAAENQVATSAADLKAILAWEPGDLPNLVKPTPQQLPALDMTLQQAIEYGLGNRADLAANREQIYSQQVSVKTAKRDSLFSYSVDAGYRRVFAEDPFQRASLTFSASVPLYDGESSRSLFEAAKLSLEAQQASFEQDVRNVRAEIESTFKEYGQNRIRYEAALAALNAAQENYRAAEAAQKEGAGDLIQVLTARVSLTTAESNFVQATYDMLISDVKFRLATGQPVPGE